MNAAKTGTIGVVSALGSILAVFLVYASLEKYSWVVNAFAIVLSGLAIGMLQGWFVQPARHRTIGLGSFSGILLCWLPVVAVTYGLALLALPLLAAFALLVFFGARLGSQLRAHCRNSA